MITFALLNNNNPMKLKPSIAFIFFFLLVFTCDLRAQDYSNSSKSSGKFTDRLVTGGNLGMQFGTQTMIDLSPMIGYKITDRFVAGIGITYRYYRSRDLIYNYVFKTSIYGGSVFARYYVLENLFAHVEYEGLSLETKYFDPYYQAHTSTRFWVGSPMAGVGYRQAIGERASFNIMLLYNFNETMYSPYNNPIIRVGVNFGI
jgi:hypothetical protein